MSEDEPTSDKAKPKGKVVSEDEPTSDKAKPKERGCVRKRANFGQGKTKRARLCLKTNQLQTRQNQKSEVVSENEPTSDKAKPKERGCVRKRANFGQGKTKRARLCPKTNQFQTRQSQKSKVVSEDKPTSDKAKPKERGCVRRRTNFGQGQTKKG
ncbi:hypothetical protein [Neobacillus cucumis]|uniref:hypothetical protein n=1 Tax=Neobacillus cucumis TaxID=1740721 RepID=UPI001963AD7B|nr:hypothetical protein [Neobacillus cucumis]MBM7656506.1 hypothetical protein [Neobacillus cucumis]